MKRFKSIVSSRCAKIMGMLIDARKTDSLPSHSGPITCPAEAQPSVLNVTGCSEKFYQTKKWVDSSGYLESSSAEDPLHAVSPGDTDVGADAGPDTLGNVKRKLNFTESSELAAQHTQKKLRCSQPSSRRRKEKLPVEQEDKSGPGVKRKLKFCETASCSSPQPVPLPPHFEETYNQHSVQSKLQNQVKEDVVICINPSEDTLLPDFFIDHESDQSDVSQVQINNSSPAAQDNIDQEISSFHPIIPEGSITQDYRTESTPSRGLFDIFETVVATSADLVTPGTSGPVTEESNADSCPLAPKKKKRQPLNPQEPSRKRSVNNKTWAANVSKAAWQAGKAHTSYSGIQKKAREIGPACSPQCNRCVNPKLSDNQRKHIFDQFWKFKTLELKRDFLSRHVRTSAPKKLYTLPGDGKQSTRTYFFTLNDREKRVCKRMFLNTLGIPDSWVETTLKKLDRGGIISPDKRGKHNNRPHRTSDEIKKSVRTHINLIPKVYSHYTRKSSKREYLETGLTIKRIYKEYVTWAEAQKLPKKATQRQYREIFNREFNIGIFKPRKDQCLLCRKWKTAQPQERRELIKEYAVHLNNKKAVNELKKSDKAAAVSDKSLCVSCFDLQKQLCCPFSETSVFFYEQKVTLYNFTVFDLHLRQGYCYIWDETDALKGANEVGSNVYSYIKMKAAQGFKDFIFYSDAPSSQNRNRFIFSMYLLAANKFKVKIVHRFLESGHSYSEVDSMHARIELESRGKHLYTRDDWIDLIKTAKQTEPQYEVFFLRNEYVQDFHHLVDKQNWMNDINKKKIYWSHVREVTADWRNGDELTFKYSFGATKALVMKVKQKRGHPVNLTNYEPPRAYNGKFPLNANKLKSLKKLCKLNAIPSSSQKFFLDLIAFSEEKHNQQDERLESAPNNIDWDEVPGDAECSDNESNCDSLDLLSDIEACQKELEDTETNSLDGDD